MSGLSSGKGLGGNQLYIAIAVWLALVLVGSACLYIGYTINPSDGGSKQAAVTPTSAVIPTATGAPVVQPTFAPYPTVESAEEVFGYGIAIHGTGGPLELMDYWMGQVDSLGLGWVKQQVRWGFFEGNPGEMDWSGYDAVVDSANKANLKVMLSVVEAPVWTRTYFDDNPEKAPPDDLAKYAEFLGRLVDRYKGRIHAIEVWNEQNLDREWDTAEGVSAERYVEMLRLSYQAIKSRDPNIIVISGALAPTGANLFDEHNPERRLTMDDFEYFDQMIAAGFLNYCDCVGAHHNGYNIGPTVPWDEAPRDSNAATARFRGPFDNPHHSWSLYSTLTTYANKIQLAGGTQRLCVTEFGWAVAEDLGGYPPGFEFAQDNTLQEQADYLVEAVQWMQESNVVWLAWIWNLNYGAQAGWDPNNDNTPYSILRPDNVPAPAWDAIAQYRMAHFSSQ